MIAKLRQLLNVGSAIVSVVVYVTLAIELILTINQSSIELFDGVHQFLFWLIGVDFLIRWVIRPVQSFGYWRLWISAVAWVPLLQDEWGWLGSIYGQFITDEWVLLMVALSRIQHLGFLFKPLRSNPTQSFVAGFILMILLGAIFLMLPMAHDGSVSFLDALFTATSAVCVTGLNVLDVGVNFSRFGQTILLLLIQVGGLGIMTFYALVTISLHQRVLSHESQEFQRGWSTDNAKETYGIVRAIFLVTGVVEGVGALLIFWAIPDSVGNVWDKLFYAVFHSVSAFCNAGFSLFSDSLAVFSGNTGIMGVIAMLIVLGGIGFPVIFELFGRVTRRGKQRFKLQTKLALYVSVGAILLGWLVFYAQSLSLGDGAAMSAFFHSVSSRTAGFSVGDLSTYSRASLWLMVLLMFIGASPGSTGGGIKTTTFGLLGVALMATIRSEEHIHVFDRQVKPALVFKALAILTISSFIVFVGFFMLLLTESLPFFPLLFETVSAFATVGFSLGITPELTSVGKIIVMILMLFGRVGPLTMAVSLTRRPTSKSYKLPDESILLG